MARDFIGFAVFFALIVAVTPLLGGYIARVFSREPTALERRIFRPLGLDAEQSMDWKSYAKSLVLFSLAGWLVLYLILRTQTLHPFDPGNYHSGSWDLSFNTASSFVTNTNWQFYGGETTLTNFSQMAGLAVQNFLSAGVGLAVAVALIRGLAGRRSAGADATATGIGNFWSDLFRATTYVLLPLSIIAALVLVSQGVLQDLGGSLKDGLFTGPVATQEAIKMLGTNGGGFFNVNSAMPFENPNGFTNILEIFLLLCIPAALTFTYGRMVGSRRQGWSIFSAMSLLFLVSVVVVYLAERHGTPAQHLAGVHGANFEGKEVRFGTAGSSLFAAATTVVSCGAVNTAFESLTGLGGLIPFVDLSYGESVFGGVGTGLYTMLMYVLLAVFLGGLMVGRTPEYLGKKVEGREIKLVTLAVLATPLTVLLSAMAALATKWGGPSIYAAGKPGGFSESLYAYMSQANNNGSAFAGYTGYYQPTPGNVGAHGITFADLVGGFAMLAGRYLPIVLVLAVAGTLSGKRVAPAGLGTMRTDTATFVALLIGVVILIGALTFLPALLLGPLTQGLTSRVF
jgi:K+-transporting ATPase ATPase A chain